MELNHNKYRYVESTWELDHQDRKTYYAIDMETKEMILIDEDTYRKANGMEELKHIKQSEVIEDYNSLMKLSVLLDKHDISYYMLNKILNYHQVNKRNSYRPNFYGIDKEALLNDFKKGMKNPDLAIKYECSYYIIAWNKSEFRRKGLLPK